MFTRGIIESVRRHKKPIVLLLLSFVLYTCVALVLTYPLIRNVSHYYFSPELESPRASGDGIGTIAGTWQAAHAGKQDAMGKATGSASYPFKMNSGGASYPLSSGILVLLARLIGAQASFNILMLLSFPLAGAIMFMLVFYVTHSGAASLLSGFLYAFSPWHTSRAFDHISLTAVHCLPLFVLALVAFWKRRDLVSAVALAGAGIIAALTDLHFGLFCAVMALTWSLALYISYLAHGREGPPFPSSKSTTHIRVALLVLLAVVIAASVSIPVYRDLFYKDPAVMPGGEGRGIKQSVANSAKPADYFIPPAYSLVWRGFTNRLVANRTGRASTSIEATLYPGIVTFILAAYALIHTLRRKKRKSEKGRPGMGVMGQSPDACSDMNEKNGRTYVIDTTVYFAAITAVAAFILSMPPLIKVGGVELPTPSIIMRSLAPVLRFYSRWGLVVTFALTLLAGVGFALLATSRNWNFRKTGVICALLVALFCVDVTIIPPWRSRDISRPPDVVRALSRLPRDEPVAMYPLKPGIYSVPLWYLYYQQYHKHPMINGVKAATEADLYLMVMNDIYAPYTPRMLKGLGIKEVVILNDFYKLMFPSGDFFNPDKMPPGYRLVKKTDDGYIFDVTAAPAQVFPLFYLNFTPPRLQPDGIAWSAMVRPEGKILLVNKGERSTFDFSVTIYNPGKEDALDVELDGGAHGRFQVPRGPSQLTVPRVELTKQRHFLTFEWSGEPAKIEGEASGVDGQLDAYLLFSRPELNRVPPGR